MVPVSSNTISGKSNTETHHHLIQKPSIDTDEKGRSEVPGDEEEKIIETRSPGKLYDEKKGFFNNYEYFNMNKVNGNKSPKPSLVTPGTTTTIPPLTSVPVTNTTISPSSTNDPPVVTRRLINTSPIIYSQRKESLENKPHIQKSLKIKQSKSQEKVLGSSSSSSSSSSSTSTSSSSSSSSQHKLKDIPLQLPTPLPTPTPDDLKNETIPLKSSVTHGIVKTNSRDALVEGKPIKMENSSEVSSISSSSTSDSISIASSNDVDNYTSPSTTQGEDFKKSYSIKSFTNKMTPLESLKDVINERSMKPSVENEKVVNEDISHGISSYDNIIPSSIREQLNKSSDMEESFDENYEKNKNILSGLSQSSYTTSTTQNGLLDKNLLMTDMEMYDSDHNTSIEENASFHIKGEKIKKKKSFLNNVFKKRSFDRKHQKHQATEE